MGARLQDRYRIQEAIKSGGMGSVFLAFDERLQGLCAVKEMHPSQDEWATRRFREEATTLSKLQHSGIPKVRDFFVQDDLHYLVMDYVAGHNLSAEIGSLSGEQAHADLLEVLAVLDYLHNLDPAMIHRDLKPGNLIRSQDGGRLMVVDFGLARSLNEETQTTAGTMMFCPPEQLLGKATPRSDLYALAATYYVLLTGREIQMGSSKPILFHRPDLAPELALAVDTALQLEPQLRYPDARSMREALLTPLVAPRRSRPWWILVVLGLAAGLWGMKPAPVPSATPGVSRTPRANPQLVFGPERLFWGRKLRTGETAEDVLAEVTAEVESQGMNGRQVLLYAEDGRALEVGMLLPEKAPGPKRLSPLYLPDGSAAWMVVTGDYAQLPTERRRVREWIVAQGYKPGQRFYEVRRIGETSQSHRERWETDLFWVVTR
ncbi:MAG: serine/threonine protein kinase [Candidatus Eremiobacteraeota bacterium]|nr:serine/threonine protein kinase [Candidatus Eremiobacteraeota bacterium]